MIREQNGVFELTTDRTTYLFRVRQNGLLEHLYYGKRVDFLKGTAGMRAVWRRLPEKERLLREMPSVMSRRI